MTSPRSWAFRYSKTSRNVDSASDGTTSNENFGIPFAWGVTVGRQLLKNCPMADSVFSTGVSTAPTTASANALARSDSECVE